VCTVGQIKFNAMFLCSLGFLILYRESEITRAFSDCKISCVAYLRVTAVLLFYVKCFVRILNMFFLDVGLHANRCTPGIMHSDYVITCEFQDTSCEDISHNKVFMFS